MIQKAALILMVIGALFFISCSTPKENSVSFENPGRDLGGPSEPTGDDDSALEETSLKSYLFSIDLNQKVTNLSIPVYDLNSEVRSIAYDNSDDSFWVLGRNHSAAFLWHYSDELPKAVGLPSWLSGSQPRGLCYYGKNSGAIVGEGFVVSFNSSDYSQLPFRFEDIGFACAYISEDTILVAGESDEKPAIWRFELSTQNGSEEIIEEDFIKGSLISISSFGQSSFACGYSAEEDTQRGILLSRTDRNNWVSIALPNFQSQFTLASVIMDDFKKGWTTGYADKTQEPLLFQIESDMATPIAVNVPGYSSPIQPYAAASSGNVLALAGSMNMGEQPFIAFMTGGIWQAVPIMNISPLESENFLLNQSAISSIISTSEGFVAVLTLEFSPK